MHGWVVVAKVDLALQGAELDRLLVADRVVAVDNCIAALDIDQMKLNGVVTAYIRIVHEELLLQHQRVVVSHQLLAQCLGRD